MTCRRPYDTDLTDLEWEHLKPLVPVVKPGGRPAIHSRREILNGIFYAVRSGSAWKLLPHDLPPWRTVYHYFWSWRRDGTWQKIHDRIRTSVRQAAGRHPEPSGAVVDSQSVRTSEQGGIRGYDAGKNVSGRKRHVLVDTLGLVLLVVVTAANAQDRAAARLLLGMLATQFRRLRVVWADGAYAGGLQDWVRRLRGKGAAGNRSQAERTARFCGPAVALDCGAYVRLAGSMATAQGRLRVFAGNHRSAHSHCDDPPRGAKTRARVIFSNAL